MKKNNLIFLFGLVIFINSSIWANELGSSNGSSSNLTQADEKYNAGECEQAIALYDRALAEPSQTETQKLQIVFKKSYCQLSLAKNSEAEAGFTNYLKQNPNNDEAKLRLAESQFYQAKYDKCKANINSIKDTQLMTEAYILYARAALEENQPSEAFNYLNKAPKNKNWDNIALYWQGVAKYKLDQNKEAKSLFTKAIETSPEKSWVITESQSWLNQIKSDSRVLKGYLTLGYLSDSNIAQSATTGFSDTQTSEGLPPKVGDSSSISDNASYLAAGLTFNLYSRSSKNISGSVYFSSPYYSSKNKSYDYKVLTFELASNFKLDNNDWWGLKLQNLKTYYDSTPSEGYLIVTPYYSWNVTSDWNLKFEPSYDKYTKTTTSSVMTETIYSYYSITQNLGFKTNLSATQGKGKKAVYDGSTNPPTITTGSAFSNYNTFGLLVGFWYQLISDLEMSAYLAQYQTSYGHESSPVPNGTRAPSDRKDTLNQYGVDLNYTLVPNQWSLDLSATISKNKSDGYQGLPAYGSLTTYKYDRNYYMLTATYSF